MISFNNVSKYFKDKCILKNVSLTFPNTGLVIIHGESGCGKSTILNMIAGIEPLTNGSIELNGNCTYILSSYDFIDELTVLENIMLKPSRHVNKRVLKLLKFLGIQSLKDRKINECSDGQRQRIGIARALVNEQEIVLCDEPSEFLDKNNRLLVINLLIEYAKSHLVIIASHDKDIINLNDSTVYNLTHHQLINEKQNSNLNDLIACKKNKINRKWVINKLMKKSRILLSLLLVILFVGLFFMLCIYQTNFLNSTSYNALIVDTCFYYKDNELSSYNNINERVIPNFENVSFNDEIIRILPLPLTMNLNQEVIINQNCSELGLKLGMNIHLNYSIMNNPYYLQFTISNIEEEKDIVGCQIYYNLEKAISKLNEDMHLNLIGKEESSWYTMRTKQGLKLYQASIGYEAIQHEYLVAQKDEVNVFQPIFTQRYEFNQNAKLYRFVFWVSLGLLMLLSGCALVNIENKEFKSLLKTLSILTIYSSNLELFKKMYIMNKVKDISLVLLVVLGLDTLLVLLCSINLTKELIVIYLLILLGVSLIEIIILIRNMSKFKITHINKYLKS